jgi:hypothetical protein
MKLGCLAARIVLTGSVLTVIVLAIVGQSVAAVALEPQETGEVQRSKDKLQELEQAIQELKTRLAEADQSKTTSTTASSIQKGTQIPAAQPATNGNNKTDGNGSKKQGSQGESTFQVYGFAMLDAGYQFRQNDPDWFDVIRPTKLPAFKDQFAPDGKTYFGVRQSRLGVKSATPTDHGELKTQVEFELFGTGVDAGQTTFRLRHAYGELGHFGAGQTWSPFMDIDVFPNSLEYWGPNGMVFFRNIQFRYMPLKGNNAITIGVERPGASADQGLFADRIELQAVRPKFDLPDLSGHARFTRGWGHVQIAGMLKRLKWTDLNNDQFDLSGSDVGWGVNVSSNLKLTKNDIARLQVVYGEGIQNYMNDAPVDVGIARGNSTDPARPIRGVALPVLGVVSFLDHNWNKQFSSSIGYSLVNIENSEGQTPDAYHRGHYALTNLLYYPVENVMVGGEFQWGRRENFQDGFASNDYRIQFSFKYSFSKLLAF